MSERRRGRDSNPCGPRDPRALKARALTTLPPRRVVGFTSSIVLCLKIFAELWLLGLCDLDYFCFAFFCV